MNIILNKNDCLMNYKNVPVSDDLNTKNDLKNKRINLKMIIGKYWKPFIIAQLLSLINSGTGIVTSELSDVYKINIPTTQSVLNYFLLMLIFIPSWILKLKNPSQFKISIKTNYWKYFLISLADVEANYFIIKAYSYTTITTIQIIDAFIFPITLVLSYFFLKQSFKLNHYLGVIGSLFGCAFIIIGDFYANGIVGVHRIKGDLFCLLASCLYAISNVGAEIFIKQSSKREYLAMIGFFGTIISIFQMMIFERTELANLMIGENITVWFLLIIETVLLFLIYTFIPCVIEFSSAAFLNLNLLTADFYSVLYGILVKKYKLEKLYFSGFFCIMLGTILYCLSDPKYRIKNSTNNKIENNENKINKNNINNNNNNPQINKLFLNEITNF